MRQGVFRDGEEMRPVQPSVAAHHVSPAWRPCLAMHDRWLRFVRTIGVSIFIVLFNLFVFFVNVDVVLAVWDVVSESDWCLALEPMALRLFVFRSTIPPSELSLRPCLPCSVSVPVLLRDEHFPNPQYPRWPRPVQLLHRRFGVECGVSAACAPRPQSLDGNLR